MARDFRGVPFSTLPEPTAPDFTFRLRNMLSEFDAWARDQSYAMGRIARGEVPDGSGDPLAPPEIDLSDFFFLPGRGGGQNARGGTGSGDDLTLSSTAHATKGNIFFGSSSSFDEVNTLLGIGDASPSAVLHANMVSPPTYIFPDADVTDGNWVTQVGGTSLFAVVNDTDDSDYITETPGSGSTCEIKLWTSGAGTISSGDSVSVSLRILRTAGTAPAGTEKLRWRLYRGGVQKATATSDFITGGAWTGFSTALSASEVTEIASPSGDVTIDFSVVGLGDTTLFYQISQVALVVGAQNDLVRWDSSGTQLGRITSTGLLGVGTSSDALSAMLTIEPLSASTVGGLVQGAASQSGNLFEFRNSSSTLLSRFTSAGVYDGPISTTSAVSVVDSSFSVLDNADTTKTLKFELGSATTGADLTLGYSSTADRALNWTLAGSAGNDLTLATTLTADRTITFPDVTGTLPTLENNHTISGNWTFTPGINGLPGPVIGVGTGSSFDDVGLHLDDNSTFFLEIKTESLTANRYAVFPDGSGTLVMQATSANIFANTGSDFESTSSGTGASFMDTGTNSKRLRFVLSGATGNNAISISSTVARVYTLGDVTSGITQLGITTSASGTLGKIALTGQTGSLTAQTLLTGTTVSAGLYRVSFYLKTTTTGDAADNVTVTLAWNDGTAQTEVIGFLGTTSNVTPYTNHDLNTANAFSHASVVVRVDASQNITFTTTLTSPGAGTPAYTIDARLEYLG